MRTHLLRSLQGLATIGVIALLTGAKASGCGGSDGGGSGGNAQTSSSSSGGPVVCGPGTHEEQTCAVDMNGDRTCQTQCVCDDCPPGSVGQWVCDGGVANPMDPNGPKQPDGMTGGGNGNCVFQCVPVDPCGPGFHQEPFCGMGGAGGGGAGGALPVDNGPNKPGDPSMQPPPPDPCPLICVPDSMCPPGTIEQTTCDGGGPVMTGSSSSSGGPPNMGSSSSSGGPNDPTCTTTCVPIDVCPPGQHIEEVCMDPSSDVCELTCVDDDPCPPGQHVEWNCPPPGMNPNDPMGPCDPVCVDDPCPPGQVVEIDCKDPNDPMSCVQTCVDPMPFSRSFSKTPSRVGHSRAKVPVHAKRVSKKG